MTYRRLWLPAMPALLVAACAVGPGDNPSSQPTPSAIAGTPSTTAAASVVPSPTAERTVAPASPTPGQTELAGIARSDAFWSLLASGGIPVEHYDSLSELNMAADLVVVASPVAAREGRSVCEPDGTSCSYFAEVELEIIERLAGPAPDGPLVIEFQVGSRIDEIIAELNGYLPDERVLFFLRDLDLEAQSLDLPAEHIETVEGKYRRCVPQGAIRDDNGTARPMPYTSLDYLLAVDGRPFERVVDSVR